MVETQKFAEMGHPRRIWAVGAIHADVSRLQALHETIAPRFRPGDRLVYLGNMIGRQAPTLATIEELLVFRRTILAMRGVLVDDVVFLRGAQEEMWHKLLQLQFAPNPREVLDWMLRQGLAVTLAAYGGSADQGLRAAVNGAIALSRWTQSLKAAVLRHQGHQNLFSALRRAAFTGHPGAIDESGGVLFVSAGVDVHRPFAHQSDSFWWGAPGFTKIGHAFGGFQRVVRGYDPARGGVTVTDWTATLDGGCGFGGPLVCACLATNGEILDILKI